MSALGYGTIYLTSYQQRTTSKIPYKGLTSGLFGIRAICQMEAWNMNFGRPPTLQ